MNDQEIRSENIEFTPLKARFVYLQIGLISIIIFVSIWYAMNTSNRIATQYSPHIDAIMEIKYETAIAHLWFEEMISGDRHEDINEVWRHLDHAEWYAQAMLFGGENEEGTFVPLNDSVLSKNIQAVLAGIQEFRLIAEKRLSYEGNSGIGSDIDQRFDDIFINFIKQADEVETVLQRVMRRDIERFKTVQISLLVLCVVLSFIIAVIIRRFQTKQSVILLRLAASNQQLRASEQQLKASNQQLRAGEQQLKASNQQLSASEQQLRATNQQLRASEQQLMASIQELKSSNQKLALHQDNTPLAVIQWDTDFCVTEWNKSAEMIFGFTREEAIGRHAAGLIVPASIKDAIDDLWSDLMNQKGGNRSSNENITKDNRSIVCDWYNSPLLDTAGNTVGVASLVLDITENQRLQELETRAERLETAGTIAGQVAHDFNNLLAPMMAYPEFIHEYLPHDCKAHAYVDAIENAAQKIADINQDLLTMGRRGHFNHEILDLNRIVIQASQELESHSEKVSIDTILCKDIMKVKGGGSQIHRMLINLIVNAHDAMDDVGRLEIKTENYYADDTSIAFGRVPKGEYVKLTVADTGCGITPEIMEKILDPFFSTKAADRRRGSGLGLSVVDSVIKDHGGYLDLLTEVGHGTSFYIYFPVTREVLNQEGIENSKGGSENILIVDDDLTQREVSTQLLEKLGYKVVALDCGEKAVNYLKEYSADLVILDMVMPNGIDGTETYRQITRIIPEQKAIILSGYSETDRVLEVQKLGAGAFIKKPVTRKGIAFAVRTELDRKKEMKIN